MILAEISDKIDRPRDAFGVGFAVGAFVFGLGLGLGRFSRWFTLILGVIGLLILSGFLIEPIDPTLAKVAENEIPGYHIQMRVALVSPVFIGTAGAWWCVGVALKLKRKRAGLCVQCGYSLEGLTSDVCPECGEVYEA